MKQAESLAWRLKKEEFDHIYTSDLVRGKQTAYEIAKHHSKTPLSKDVRLREQDLGDLTGLSWPDAKCILKSQDRSFDDHIAETGESNHIFKERVIDFYANLIECHLVQPHDQLLRASSTDSLASRAVLGDDDNDDDDGDGDGQVQQQHNGMESTQQQQQQQQQQQRTTTNSTSSTTRSPSSLPTSASTTSLKHPQPRSPRMRQINILVVTHGGWIQRLMEHLLEDLNFQPDCDLAHGFPKNTAVYKFVISKLFTRDGADYEWEGRIKLMNCVAHLAGMNKRETTTPNNNNPASTTTVGNMALLKQHSPAQSPVMLRKARQSMGSNASGLAFGKSTKTGLQQMFRAGGAHKMPPMTAPVPTERVKSLGW
ncbi:hypothetical protein PhCBS80983_g06395 [Powellomyces hirtus]|uniref:Phosphoglycerate mutase n=1 Tax=Powellomyces hirtus TaxID=109895 RepID=A0A507DN42_9FUNG|nr:hypothetical protein PhCBS80983_g06395 [Powellomyces hirtus]